MTMPLIVLKYGLFIFIPWVLGFFTYRVALHPLRRFPGPFIAVLSDWYGGYLALTKRAHLVIWQDHEEYGSVMRYGPDRLLFNSATAVQDIYQNPRMTKSRLYLASKSNEPLHVFNTLDPDVHRQKRKVISQPLTDRSLRKFEPIMVEQIDIFLDRIRNDASNGHPVNLSERCERLGMDIIGHLAFGYPLNLQTDETYRFLPRALAAGKTRINVLMHQPVLRKFNPVIRFLTKRRRQRIMHMLKTMISSRMALGENARPDFYSFAASNLDAAGHGTPENNELWTEATFFITAGGTPPATTICALLFYLSRNNTAYATLAHEIRSVFHAGDEIKGGPKLSSCQYLPACIDESMRLSPPSLATLWREQREDDDNASPIIIDGHIVPRGTHVGVSIYSLHHNEDYFADSFAFKPERWMPPSKTGDTEDEAAARSRMRKAFIPFIVGPRACAGKSMAYLETSLVVAKILWYFDFESAPGELGKVGARHAGRDDGTEKTDEFLLYDVFNSAHEGPNLVLKAREGLI